MPDGSVRNPFISPIIEYREKSAQRRQSWQEWHWNHWARYCADPLSPDYWSDTVCDGIKEQFRVVDHVWREEVRTRSLPETN